MKKKLYEKTLEFVKKHKLIIIILIIALILRLVVLFFIAPMSADEVSSMVLVFDGTGYNKFAINILENGLINDYYPKRVPGYSLFIAFVYLLFGYSAKMVLFFQSLLDVGTVLVIYLIAKNLFKKEAIALIAAALYTANLAFFEYAIAYTAEIFFTFIFSIAILLFIYALKKKKIRYFALAGLLFSISVLTRPAVSFIIYPLIFFILINKYSFKQKCVFILVIFLVFMIPISLWKARNLYYYDYYELYSNQGHYLSNRAVAQSMAYTDGISFKEAEKIRTALIGKIDNPFEKSEKLMALGKEYIINNPGKYLSSHFKRHRKFFFDVKLGKLNKQMRDSGIEYSRKNLEFLMETQLYLEYLFLILGFIFIFKMKNKRIAKSYVILIILLLIIFVTGASVRGMARYKFPLIPLYLVISAAGIYYTAKFIRNSKFRKKIIKLKK